MGKLSAAHAHRLLTHNVIPRAYLATVVERVLRSAAVSGGEKRLRRLVRRQVDLPGYEDPWQAPPEELLHATLEAVEISAPLWRAVLRAWARGEGALGALATSYLEERFGASGAPPEGWTPDVLRAAVDAVLGTMPGVAHNDVALMLCWLTGYVPLPEDEAATEAPSQGPTLTSAAQPVPGETLPAPRLGGVEHWQALFREVLAGLRQLAADSPVWEAVAGFIDDLRRLIEDKRVERDAARDRLRRALDALRAEAEVDPGYFAFTDMALWRAERAPLDRVPDLALIADNLRQHLRHHRRLRAAVPATVSEGLVQRMRLHTLESAALAAHARLAEELGGGRAVEAPAPSMEKPAAAADRPAAAGLPAAAAMPEEPPCPPPPPQAAEPPREETPPGPEPVLEIIVEEEEPAPAPAPGGPPGAGREADAGPPAGPPREAIPQPPLVAPAPRRREPRAAASAEKPGTREEPPPPMPEPPAVTVPDARARTPIPEAPLVEPEEPGEPPDEGMPEPPGVAPAETTEGDEAAAGEPGAAATARPGDEEPIPPAAPPDEEEGYVPSLRVATQAGRAGSWFSDLAHWEPLARDAHAHRQVATNGAARPPRGLAGALHRARRFFARLLRRGL